MTNPSVEPIHKRKEIKRQTRKTKTKGKHKKKNKFKGGEPTARLEKTQIKCLLLCIRMA
jgi:hypothetical protein